MQKAAIYCWSQRVFWGFVRLIFLFVVLLVSILIVWMLTCASWVIFGVFGMLFAAPLASLTGYEAKTIETFCQNGGKVIGFVSGIWFAKILLFPKHLFRPDFLRHSLWRHSLWRHSRGEQKQTE